MPKAIGQFTIYDFHDVYSAATAPQNPKIDMIWLDTSLKPPVLKVYTSTGWKTANEYIFGGRNLMSDSKTTETFTAFSGKVNHCMFYRKVTLSPDIKAGDKISVSLTYKYKNIVLVEGKEASARLYVQGSGDVTSWNPGFNSSPNIIPIIELGNEEELAYYQTYSFTLSSTQATNKSFSVGIRTDYIESGSLSLYEMKVEKGEVTGWTPAPEDTEEVVKNHTTQLNTQKGQIDTLIQDTTITKNGVTTKLKDEYNKTVDTVNSHTQTLSSHDSTLKDLDGSIISVDSKVNEVKKTLEGTITTVSETSSKVGELEKTVSNQGTSITQLKDSVALRVTQEEVDTSINKVEIGGRNVIRLAYIANGGCSTFNYDKETNTWTCVAPKGSTSWGYGFVISSGGKIPVEKGKTFLVSLEVNPSVDCKWNADVNNSYTGNTGGNDNDDTSKRKNSSRDLKANIWNKCWFSYTAKSDVDYDLYDANSNWGIVTTSLTEDVSFKFRNVQGEYGTKPTDFTVAQEDISEEIENAVKVVSDELLKFKNDTETNISSVSKSVASLKEDVNGSIKDGIINKAETIAISNSIDSLNKEKDDLVNRYTTLYSNINLNGNAKTNLNTKYTAYVTAHTNLINTINSMIADNVATAAEKVTYKTKLSEYSTALSRLSQAFDTAINNVALNEAIAKDEALKTTLQNNIDAVGKVANAAKSAIGDYTADGILDLAEKESVKTHLSNLASEKVGIYKEYYTLYNTADLTGTAKTNLKSAYDNYVTKYNDLVTKINTLLNAATITDTMRTNISTAFTTHDTYLSTYSQRVSEAITAISEKKKQDSITTSNNYYDAQIKLDKKNLTASFTEMHNAGYEQGITSINKDGVEVTHSNANTKTRMSADGLSIIDENGEVIAWVSSKTQWTEIKADKVFAENVENVYQGSENLYVDHSYTGISDGSSEKPFSSFSDLQNYLSLTPIINKDLYIYVKNPNFEITEQLLLHSLKGAGFIKIIFDSKVTMRGPGAGQFCVRMYQIAKRVLIEGGRSGPTASDGALLLDQVGSNGASGHGIFASDVNTLEINFLSINCVNWGILVQNTDLYTYAVDFGKCYCAVELQRQSIYYSSADCGSGTNFVNIRSGGKAFWGNTSECQRPNGNCNAYNGIFYSFAYCAVVQSHRFGSGQTKPSTPTTNNYAQNFAWTSHKTYQYQWSNWGDSDCKQGSWGYGLRGGHMFFDIAAIRSFLSGTVLDGNTITLTRASSGGLSGASNVYINGSTCSSASGTPSYSNQTLLGTLAWGETKTFTLPKAIVQSLKSGACSSLAVYVNSSAQNNYINIVNCSITLKVSK